LEVYSNGSCDSECAEETRTSAPLNAVAALKISTALEVAVASLRVIVPTLEVATSLEIAITARVVSALEVVGQIAPVEGRPPQTEAGYEKSKGAECRDHTQCDDNDHQISRAGGLLRLYRICRHFTPCYG